MKKLLFVALLAAGWSGIAQDISPTTGAEMQASLQQQAAMKARSLVKNIPFTQIGPTVMSGRVVDVAVNPDKPSEFYVGYASGGLWYTNNNGTSFSPLMDNAPTQNVGDIAVNWASGTIWVGTGENNSSRSSYAGIGLLKSTDQGKTWQHMGLEDSHHIGRILINPNDPQEVVVGVLGHLYTPNENRGLYKTTDGGNSWTKTLHVSDNAGIIEVAAAPEDFNTLYAASWEKDRKAWHFEGSGTGSALYKSTDAGSTWTLISTQDSGFPTGAGVGRIGLAVYDANTVYAVHDSQFRIETEKDSNARKSEALTKEDFKAMDSKAFMKLSDGKLNQYLKSNGFQEKYRAQNVKQLVQAGTVKPADLATYLEDANALLFNTPVTGAEVYLSSNGGSTWTKQNEQPIEGLFFSYGYYFAQISVATQNKDYIVLSGVPLLASANGGKTFKNIGGDNVHSDHHHVWINPADQNHMINGNDGGINITYDGGAHWIKNNTPTVGQFYYINTDNETPYNVYGGLQDNGVWKAANNAPLNTRWHATGQNPWESIMGGDGMQVQIDNRNSDIVYTGFQFGNYFRLDLSSGKQTYIQPKHELGDAPFRFNWQTPILLSSHNQDVLYLGSNRLHRSVDRGTTWETISGDLTQGGKKGNVAFGTLTVIGASAFDFDLLYTGSDDGLLHRTTDGGASWTKISNGLPEDLWVSSLEASVHKKDRVVAALNGYRNDHFTPYIFLSKNGGDAWKNIASNLPLGAVNSVTEDPNHDHILYAGTDNGLYVTLDLGATWHAFSTNLPAVAVHDVVVQARDKHLLAGTHGRSIFKADIAALGPLATQMAAGNTPALELFALEKQRVSPRWGMARGFSDPYTPQISMDFFAVQAGAVSVSVQDANGIEVNSMTLQADAGFNSAPFHMNFSKSGKTAFLKKNKTSLSAAADGNTYLPKGSYKVVLSAGKVKSSQELILQ